MLYPISLSIIVAVVFSALIGAGIVLDIALLRYVGGFALLGLLLVWAIVIYLFKD